MTTIVAFATDAATAVVAQFADLLDGHSEYGDPIPVGGKA